MSTRRRIVPGTTIRYRYPFLSFDVLNTGKNTRTVRVWPYGIFQLLVVEYEYGLAMRCRLQTWWLIMAIMGRQDQAEGA
eukprot:scaffold324922_cov22-Prasinocladus_malaysianus.AAC.1